MKKMITFTKIKQYRNVIKDVCWQDPANPVSTFPTLKFKGTVKLHGTNAGVSYSTEDGLWAQSRKNIITVEKDNAGFAFFVNSKKDYFETLLKKYHKEDFITTIFGEWCGGNIQKGVAINGLEKMFVIFAIKFTDIDDPDKHYYREIEDSSPDNGIFNSTMFPKYEIDIDFNQPKLAQAKLVEMVEGVEKECPVGKYFGNIGIGEGIVFCNYDEGGILQHIFKAKGEKHSASKVRTIAKVDVEKVQSIQKFIEYAVTENRLNQAIEQVFTINSIEPDIKMMRDFLSWVSKDVMAEEMDTMVDNNLEPKDIGRDLGKKARNWFIDYLNNNL